MICTQKRIIFDSLAASFMTCNNKSGPGKWVESAKLRIENVGVQQMQFRLVPTILFRIFGRTILYCLAFSSTLPCIVVTLCLHICAIPPPVYTTYKKKKHLTKTPNCGIATTKSCLSYLLLLSIIYTTNYPSI